jgi:Immunoglobulin-like domain of bacterial spore germination
VKNKFWLDIILAIIIIVLLAVLILVPAKNNQTQKVEDIQIISPKPNEEITSPLKITGIVNGNGWSGFEGQVGTVSIADAQDRGVAIAKGVLNATTDWTKLPTDFEVVFNFKPFIGKGFLRFKNENPSGDPSKDKTFDLPVIFK